MSKSNTEHRRLSYAIQASLSVLMIVLTVLMMAQVHNI